jgi:hypothetical protein
MLLCDLFDQGVDCFPFTILLSDMGHVVVEKLYSLRKMKC